MMNEKIKELIEEAEIGIFWNRDNPDYKWIEGTEEDLIKFAELIVKECMDLVIAHEDDAPKEFDTLWHHMKEHFGVE
jgi:hypothetical protein